jgi:hypothetical protein
VGILEQKTGVIERPTAPVEAIIRGRTSWERLISFRYAAS